MFRKQKLYVALILVLFNCSRNENWIPIAWEISAKQEIKKCQVVGKQEKAFAMEKFAIEKGVKAIIGREFSDKRKIFIVEQMSLMHPHYSVLLNVAGDSVVYNFEYDKSLDSFKKEIVEESEYSPYFYKNLFNNFEQYFVCDSSNSDTELYLILER